MSDRVKAPQSREQGPKLLDEALLDRAVGAEKVQVSEISVGKHTDQSSPTLMHG